MNDQVNHQFSSQNTFQQIQHGKQHSFLKHNTLHNCIRYSHGWFREMQNMNWSWYLNFSWVQWITISTTMASHLVTVFSISGYSPKLLSAKWIHHQKSFNSCHQALLFVDITHVHNPWINRNSSPCCHLWLIWAQTTCARQLLTIFTPPLLSPSTPMSGLAGLSSPPHHIGKHLHIVLIRYNFICQHLPPTLHQYIHMPGN